MKHLWYFLLYIIAVFVSARLLEGVKMKGFATAAMVAVLLSVADWTIKPLLKILTFPINFLTLGLFTWVINAIIIIIIDKILDDFEVDGFWWALIYSVILAAVNAVLQMIF